MKLRIEYGIDFSALSDFIEVAVGRMNAADSYTAMAIKTAGEHFMHAWIKTAEGKFKHSSGGYAKGIMEGVSYPYNNDYLSFNITHVHKYALYLERGFEPFDMKKALLTSDKVRVSKEGKRYLIIPFEHGTPGSRTKRPMPDEVYREARKMKQSFISARFQEGVQQGAKSFADAQLLKVHNPKKVFRNRYKWGDKLSAATDPKYDGMYRFQRNVNNARDQFQYSGKFLLNKSDNSRDYSGYLTFRVMSENSKPESWIHPGQKPMNILHDTLEQEKNRVLELISQGVMTDFRNLGFLH